MTALREALEELVDQCEHEYGDWEDVLRRAGTARQAPPPVAARAPSPPRRRRRRRRRTALLALTLLALAVALFATPAFGLRQAVLDLISREDVAFEEGSPAPGVVRRQFEDLALGVPPRHDPQALPNRMREVGTFRLGGRERRLWVGPTRRGGFCYSLERRGGGCLADPRDPEPPPIAHSLSGRQRVGEPFEVLSMTGWIFAPNAARLTLEFENGTSRDLPFVYVSPPIDAGFFAYGTTSAQRREPLRPSALVLRDDSGGVLARSELGLARLSRPLGPFARGPQPPRPLPARPPVAPAPPLQQGEARGVTVTAGSNGAVLFDATRADAVVARLRGKAATFGCFHLLEQRTQALGHSGRFGATVGLRLFGLTTPYDGCEIRGSYGHRWPDRLDSHSPVEVAFTPAGERYFADRAAARDLALFVRSGTVQRLRRLEGPALERALRSRFGDAIDRLANRAERPPPGRIGVWAGADRAIFREVSATGRVFEVEVVDGRVARENVEPYTKVF